MFDIEVLTADDWMVLRDVRLKALKDSPEAYLSSYDLENSWTETDWRRSFVDGLWVTVFAEGRSVGIARSIRVPGRSTDERHVESVWVDPEHRRAGVMRAILEFLTETEPGVRDWLLWVLDGNANAREVYERLGFEPTGERQPLSDHTGRIEERFRLSPSGHLLL